MTIQPTFVQLAAAGASANEITAVAIREWRQLDVALIPIVGKRSLFAIYEQALNVVRTQHPNLVKALKENTSFIDFTSLQSALANQTGALAVIANLALYQSFSILLAGLIGAHLTERLLQSVHNSAGGRVLERRHIWRKN